MDFGHNGSFLICGLLIDTLLVVNNYRDREADARSGKRTVIVRFGEKFGRYLYLMLGVTASLLCFWFFSKDTCLPHFFRYSPDSSCPHMETDGADSQW